MEQPSTKKAKIEGAPSGVIIIDPSAFYNSNIKQPREQYILPPLGKDFFLKTPKSTANAKLRTLTTLAPPAAMGQVPPLDITQNQNTKKLNAVSLTPTPRQVVHTPQFSQSKQMKLLGKPIQPGNKALVKQSNSQPNKSPKDITQNQLLNHSNEPAKQSTQQPIPKQLNIQANLSAHQSLLPLKISNLLTKDQANLPSERSVKSMHNDSKFQYIEFINEALFDSEEISRNQVISVADSDYEVTALEEETFEYMLQIHKTHSVATETEEIEYASNGVQTDEATEDRINCGFVNVSKYGPDKYFNLRCFYCDAEYPISFWSEFSDHVIETHGDLEKAFAENKAKSITSEINGINDSDSSDGVIQEDLPPINLFFNLIDKERNLLLQSQEQQPKLAESFRELLPEDFDIGDESDTGSDAEKYYMSVEKYDPNVDHNYSQNCLNSTMKLMKNAKAVDEIIFDKTSRDIVLDFLDHLKGFRSLWYSRSNASLSYDNELLDLMDIMTDKWGLNLKRGRLRRNLENIKAWFIGMTVSKEESGDKFFQHKFIEYYNKCAEYLPSGNTSKLQKVLCDLCDRFCFDLIGLQLHKYRKHNIGQLPYGCNKCDKRFDYVHKLRNHLRKHVVPPVVRRYVPPKILPAPEPDLTCAECNETFKIWSDFKRHLEIHPKGDCPYVCEDCGNLFKTVALRAAHRKRHQEPAFQCELCPKKFYFAYHFQQHMNGHRGIKNYVCEWCGKMFTHQKIFKEHVQYVHLGRGFCKICNRYYNKSCIFSKHLRTMHRPLIGSIEELTKRRRGSCKGGSRKGKGTGPRLSTRKYTYVIDPVTQKRRLLCPNCDKSYYQYDSLYSHVKKVHGCSVPGYHKRVTGNQKLFKSSKKNTKKAVPDKVLNTEAETTTAVNSIIENSNTKFDNPIDQRTSVDLSSRTCTTTDEENSTGYSNLVENDIKNGENATSMSFEKFIGEIAISNNFILQSPSNLQPTLIDAEDKSIGVYGQSPEKAETASELKIEDYGAIDYEFILNGSSVLNF
ncbi:uncharacterized protein LOC128867297 [Anastrepha ludens]|uniref:uncharacterized protein LOC128867297 n=1 Tax=Anastrepha ludens TaxID=28586 RepID=UPI0023B0E1FF|nr:uncharacterized protein LOC128867297 [Anastrepha ludens]